MPRRALSPSTSPPPTHPLRKTHLGIRCRTVRATQGWASSSSRHPTTPSYKSRRWCSYMFLPSRVLHHPLRPIDRGRYSTPRSTPPRCRRFASRQPPSNSHRHATTPGNYCRCCCFPQRRRPPPTFHSRISRFGPSQTHSIPRSSGLMYYWLSM